MKFKKLLIGTSTAFLISSMVGSAFADLNQSQSSDMSTLAMQNAIVQSLNSNDPGAAKLLSGQEVTVNKEVILAGGGTPGGYPVMPMPSP